jgi:hypothetical protein
LARTAGCAWLAACTRGDGGTAKLADITPLRDLLHRHEQVVGGDAGYHRIDRTLDAPPDT